MIPDPLVLGCILVGSRPHPNLTFTRIIHHGTGVYLVCNATRFQITGQNVTIPCCLTFKSTHFPYFWPWLLVPHCRVVDGGRSVSFGLGQFKCLRHAACLQYGTYMPSTGGTRLILSIVNINLGDKKVITESEASTRTDE